MRHLACFVFQVQDNPIFHRLMMLVGVDVGTKHIVGSLAVLSKQGSAGKADEYGAGQPALHLVVHVAALGTVAFIHQHIEVALRVGRRALQVGRVELVDECAQQTRRWGFQLANQLRAGGDAGGG